MSFLEPAYSAAQLGDPQLNHRLKLLIEAFSAHPGGSLPHACPTPAALKGAYRFYAHPATTVPRLLPAFVQPVFQAVRELSEVISVQDSTSFNFTHLPAAAGLGFLNDSLTARGLHLHSTLLLDPQGNLVGLGHLHFWVRETRRTETPAELRQLPIEEKESFKWLQGVRAVQAVKAVEASATTRPPRLIHVMDREGDIHEVFAEVKNWGDHAVIRCAQNRRVVGETDPQVEYGKQRVARQSSLGLATLEVPTKSGGLRTATVEVRAATVILCPKQGRHRHRHRLKLGLIEIRESTTPPAGEVAVSWWLWTTLRVTKLKDVARVLKIYRLRWRIEDYHRTLKTGCQVEKLRLQEGSKLMKAIALQAWVATRIVRLRDEGKNHPEQTCELSFTSAEWQLLWARHHGRSWQASDGVPTLGLVLRWLGRLGGHLGRKKDPLPGAECLGKALYALELLLEGQALGEAKASARQAALPPSADESPPPASSHQRINIPRG